MGEDTSKVLDFGHMVHSASWYYFTSCNRNVGIFEINIVETSF